MTSHIQGVFLLIVLLLALWGAWVWGGAIIAGALDGPDAAVVATARPPVDPSDEPLDTLEVAELQAALIDAGFDPGPVDGIIGELTSEAMTRAREALGLAGVSDRVLLERLVTRAELVPEDVPVPDQDPVPS